MSPRVLMVDDEEDLVWSTTRRMQKERPDLAVEGHTDPVKALTRVREVRPDLLITDLRMPGMSGLELLLAARQEVPELPVIVVTAYGSPELRTEVQGKRAVQYLEKPLAFQALMGAVDRALTPASGFSGAIELPMLPDLIQIYALSNMTGALRIVRAGHTGGVWFDRGQVVHSECEGLVGTQAFYRLLTWRGGTFQMDAGAIAPRVTVSEPWQGLLVEGCRLMDEEGRREPASGTIEEKAREAWKAMEARAAGWPAGAVAVATSLAAEEGVVLLGESDGRAWAQPIAAMVDAASRVAGRTTHGAFEFVTEGFGIAVAWSVGVGLALVYAQPWEGGSGASRFRSDAVRWREECAAGLRNMGEPSGTAEESDARHR